MTNTAPAHGQLPARVALSAGIALLVALAGCRAGPGPRDSFHRVEAPPPQTPSPALLLTGVLEVDRFGSEAVLVALPILYRSSASSPEILRYGYHLWTDPATLMLQRSIGRYVEGAGWAERVVYPEQRVQADYALRGRVEQLEHLRDAPAAALTLQLDLVDVHDGRSLYSGRYSEVEPATDTSVAAAVDAFGTGLARILERFRADVSRAEGQATRTP